MGITAQIQPYLTQAPGFIGPFGALFRVVGAAVTFAWVASTVPRNVATRLMTHSSFGLPPALRALTAECRIRHRPRPITGSSRRAREPANAFGDLARGKRNWQLVALWTLALLTISVVAYVRLAESVRVVPYVVAVDRVGQVIAVEEARPLHALDPRLVAAQLATFLRAVRGCSRRRRRSSRPT